MRVLEIGFQFHIPSKRENILSDFFLVKNRVFSQKSQISGILKKSILHFKDALIRSSKHCWSEMQQ